MEASARARERIEDHLEERAARMAPLPHPLEAYAGTYYSPILGTIDWRVVAEGLEMHMGIVRSRAEIYHAPSSRLRVEVGGGGQVVQFSFPEAGGPAESLSLAGVTFERIRDSQ